MQLLMSNMKPVLQFHLTDRNFTTINELIKSCTAWEDTIKRCRSQPEWAPVSRRVVNEISLGHDNESYRYDSLGNSAKEELSTDVSLSALQTTPRIPIKTSSSPGPVIPNRSVSSPNNLEICYNCSNLGHVFKNCPIAPTGVFCYRCGHRDTITPRCPNCSGNQSSGPWRSGIRGPPTIQPPGKQLSDAVTNTDPELARRNCPRNRGSLTSNQPQYLG